MTVEEIKENIGQIVWHIGFGYAKIKEWDEKNQLVVLTNPKDNSRWFAEGELHKLEIIKGLNIEGMIKVRIEEIEDNLVFETEVPELPKLEHKIGAWFNGVWCICSINDIIHEFDEDGKFLLVEIGVITL